MNGLQGKLTSLQLLHLKKGLHTEYLNCTFIKLQFHVLRNLQAGGNSLKPGMQQLRCVAEMLIESSYAEGKDLIEWP